MSDGSGRKTIYGYDRQGRLTTTTRPDGSVESLSYDERSNVVIREDKAASGVILQRYEYSYDESGNITSIKESVKKDSEDESKDIEDGKTAENMTVTTSMEYDSANRLIRYNGIEVKYDADGNMIYGPLNGEMVSFLDPFGLSKLHNTIASIRGAYNIIHKALADPFYVVNNAI